MQKRADFEKAYSEGAKVVSAAFAMFVRPNGLDHSRIGVTATRKLGKHVTRNRARRLVREAFRMHQHDFPPGLDIVVVVRAPLLGLKPAELGPILLRAAERAGRRLSA